MGFPVSYAAMRLALGAASPLSCREIGFGRWPKLSRCIQRYRRGPLPESPGGIGEAVTERVHVRRCETTVTLPIMPRSLQAHGTSAAGMAYDFAINP